MTSITITSPTPSSTVNRPFTASGTYTTGDPVVAISVVLKNSAGTVVANGMPVMAAGGNWSAPLNPGQGYTGATVEATLNTASDSVGNITVN